MNEPRISIGRQISLLYRHGQMFAGDRLKEHGIGRGQYIFLNALYHEDGISQEALSDTLRIDKGTTAKAVKKLEQEGYITRRSSPGDKRVNQVKLTEKARVIEPVIRGVLLEWRDILTEGFTVEEKLQIHGLLERMGQNATSCMTGTSGPFKRTDTAEAGENTSGGEK